jgi:hypothetical protein
MAAKGVGIVMWVVFGCRRRRATAGGQLDVQLTRLAIASALAQAAPLAWPRL